jgi:hypothetical protein
MASKTAAEEDLTAGLNRATPWQHITLDGSALYVTARDLRHILI